VLAYAPLFIGEPRRWVGRLLGREDFDYPGTARLLELPPIRPTLLHGHNLHGGYFDLRELARLSHSVPTVLTLHDAWLLSGHCAHSFGCDRWLTGCGHCPDLSIYPAIPRDATGGNWRIKSSIYAKSRLFVATPSRWLMSRVQRSILSQGIVEARVIPNGVDLTVFAPGDQGQARRELRLPAESAVVVVPANALRQNPFKDMPLLRAVLIGVAERVAERDVTFVAVGDSGPAELIGPRAQLRYVPFTADRRDVARWLQAADAYVHPSRADTFPLAVLEALACGVPVVATAVGGIPEQVEDGSTGFLTRPGDAREMTEALLRLIEEPALRTRLGRTAAADARSRFDLTAQVDRYLDWYCEILGPDQAPTMRPVPS
jgi:glycosyltransferase involved in cell wall biosynthesis